MSNDSVFEKAGRLFFSREQIKGYENQISAAGISLPAESFAGYVGINIIVATVFLTAIILLFRPITMEVNQIFTDLRLPLPFPIFALISLVISLISAYLGAKALTSTYLLMKADDRRNKLEIVLPDFLNLVSSNIKAGMTLDQAIWYSAKPEFGILTTEIKETIKGAFSGDTLENALDKLSARFDSKTFKRTILLLKQASATGGELTSVLEKTADDVRDNQIMKKEISATLVLYEIFVLVASALGTPFLFAVATKIVQIFEKIAPQIKDTNSIGSNAILGGITNIKLGAPLISTKEFFYFAMIIIFITGLMSSMIVSIIRKGNTTQTMKYFPFVLIISYTVYWIIITIVDVFFAQFS
ncbi:type II secretion system F family protein [Candidatus Micrarchaeota archaeon]|nr:type II secretion system F family protein [Candidatus Micrarchaeota archaeon]